MSFGFSFGDFVAAGALIDDVVRSLRNAGGSQEDYQELIRQLECLDRVLQHVDKLESNGCHPKYLYAAKCAALSCQYPLKEFQTKIKKYELRLGIRATRHGPVSALRKVEWELRMKESVQSLRAIVTQWVTTINAFLSMQGLELTERTHTEACEERTKIQQEVQRCHEAVKITQHDVRSQSSLINGTITKLLAAVRGDVTQPLVALRDLVTTAW